MCEQYMIELLSEDGNEPVPCGVIDMRAFRTPELAWTYMENFVAAAGRWQHVVITCPATGGVAVYERTPYPDSE